MFDTVEWAKLALAINEILSFLSLPSFLCGALSQDSECLAGIVFLHRDRISNSSSSESKKRSKRSESEKSVEWNVKREKNINSSYYILDSFQFSFLFSKHLWYENTYQNIVVVLFSLILNGYMLAGLVQNQMLVCNF